MVALSLGRLLAGSASKHHDKPPSRRQNRQATHLTFRALPYSRLISIKADSGQESLYNSPVSPLFCSGIADPEMQRTQMARTVL
jgi:hypothetical protein